MEEVKDDKVEVSEEPKAYGVNLPERDKRQELQKNIQTCGLFLAERLERKNRIYKISINKNTHLGCFCFLSSDIINIWNNNQKYQKKRNSQ
jgi:hypothetical protein